MGEQAKAELDLSSLFKDLAWDALIKFVFDKVVAQVPFLGWGPVGLITQFVINIVAGELYGAFAEFIDLKVIAFKNETLYSEYKNASLKLRAIAVSKGIDSPEYKAERELHKKALSSFIRYGA